jgi:hypothetical protein
MSPEGRLRIGALQSIHEFGYGDAQAVCYFLKQSDTGFLLSDLQVRYVILVNTSVFGKVDLPPTASFPQFSDSLSQQDANVSCHPVYGGTKLASVFLL